MNDFPLDGMRVLVLEDEFLIALDVEQLCREHGAADVVIVNNLDALAPDPFTAEPFHAAILDVMLAGRRTTDFASQLVERAVPFVFATGYSDSEDMFEGFEGIPVVGKPYSGRDLLDALTGAIGRVRQRSGGV